MKTLYPLITLSLLISGPGLQANDSPPNIVLIISDDQAWYDFGFTGSQDIATPHLDRLAAESAVFSRGYVPTSLCKPSLVTMITGLYPHNHQVGIHARPLGHRDTVQRLFRDHGALPSWLQQREYRSLQTGKWWEGHYRDAGFTHGSATGMIPPVDATRQGPHDYFDGPVNPTEGQPTPLTAATLRTLTYMAGGTSLKIGRETMQPIVDFLDDTGDKPFFLWYAPMLPHTPHNPPERLLKKYLVADTPRPVAAYRAMCEWFDETCGQLLRILDERGLSENTLVVFVVDNGWIQDPTQVWWDPRSKASPYEAGVRTPVMLRWPGRIAPQRNDEAVVHTTDLAPTILEACGTTSGASLPGESLLPICAGEELKRDAVFGAIFANNLGVLDGRPERSLSHRWCVSGKWKLIVPWPDAASTELFDLKLDPHEKHDVSERHPDIVQKLTQTMDTWWDPAVF